MTAYTRRDALRQLGLGLGSMAFSSLVARAEQGVPTHHPAKAKRVVHIFPQGGPGQMDTFDPKPQMAKWDGKPMPGREPRAGTKIGGVWHSPFKFKKYGRCGLEVSELFPHVAAHADDLWVIRSMHTDTPDHPTMALLLLCCGDARLPRPSAGAGVQYGLGTANANLPAYVVLNTAGRPLGGASLWQAAFLPAQYQGVYVDTAASARRADELIQHVRSPHTHLADQRAALDLLGELNRQHAAARGPDRLLAARLESFELAYRMQIEATDAFDLHREPRRVIDRYGDTPMGRQMLLTRRLLERGVRYVQIFDGDISPWDDHNDLVKHYRQLALESDRPIAAFLTDLKRLGLFDDTLVVWASEFGRTATAEIGPTQKFETAGRDHNHHGYSVWLAGGGVKGGIRYGETDDFGVKGVRDRVHVHDLHATMLHLLGFDHLRLTYRYAGRDFRLTDVKGQVVKGVLA